MEAGEATKPVNLEEDIRIRSPEIVEGLTKSMEEGAKIHCTKLGNANACMSLSDYYRQTGKVPLAAKVVLSCCDRLQNPECCWEAGILRMNGFEKTQVTRDFHKAVDNFRTTCFTENKAYKDVQARACYSLAEIMKRDLSLAANKQKQVHPKVKELMEEMSVKSLAIKACKLGSWEACNAYAVMSFDGLFGVKEDISFGLNLAERACMEGSEMKACVNLIKIYEEGLLGIDSRAPLSIEKLNMYQAQFQNVTGEKYEFVDPLEQK